MIFIAKMKVRFANLFGIEGPILSQTEYRAILPWLLKRNAKKVDKLRSGKGK